MVLVAVRDQDRVDRRELGQRARAPQVQHAAAHERVRQQPHAVQLDQRGGVAEVRDPAQVRHPIRVMPAPGASTTVRTAMSAEASYGESPAWKPERPRFRPFRLLISWLVAAASLLAAAYLVPGIAVHGFGGAVVAALLIAVLNAILPPVVAALRIPFMALLGFFVVLLVDAALLEFAAWIRPEAITVDSFGWALLAALVASGVGVVLEVGFGTNDDDTYSLRVVRRIARRQGGTRTDIPGIIFLEIDGLALPVLRRAMRDGSAPTLASWLGDGTHRLVEWEPDLSSQTGASQAGILLGSNDDIPAFRWVDKETGRVIACSGPADCAEIERTHATGIGLLVNGGSSRANLFSGEAEETILTSSRISAEKRANPGYRAYFANGFNVTRTLVLFFWEIVLEWSAALRAIRRDVRPRGHRGRGAAWAPDDDPPGTIPPLAGQVLGEQDLQTPLPVRVFVFKNARGWTSTAPISEGRDRYSIVLGEKSVIGARDLSRAGPPLPANQLRANAAGIRTRTDRFLLHLRSERDPHHRRHAPAKPDLDWARIHLLMTDPDYFGKLRVLLYNLRRGVAEDPAYRNAFGKSAAEVEAAAKKHFAAGNFQTTHSPARPWPRAISRSARSPTSISVSRAPTCWPARSLPPNTRSCSQPRERPPKPRKVSACWPCAIGTTRTRASTSPPPSRPAAPARAATSNTPSWSPTTTRPRTRCCKAAGINPKLDEPFALMAARDTDPRKRMAHWKAAAERNPRNPAYWKSLAEAYLAEHNYGEAAKAWRSGEQAATDPEERERMPPRACRSSSSAWITKRPRSAARPRRRRAKSRSLKSRGARRTARGRGQVQRRRRSADATRRCPGGMGRSPAAR